MHPLRTLILLALSSITLLAIAMPAHPGKRWVTLPDGTRREAILRGDERCHWLEALDGTRLTKPISSLPRTQADGITSRRRAKGNPMLLDGCFPTTGKRKLLAVLVNFADTRTTYSQQDFHNMMNQENYKGVGSFRDYYLQQSYGQLDIETTVTRWVTLSKNKALYSGDYVTNLIHEALQALDSEIDFNDYDNDGDGILDGLIVIHQGAGQESSANANDIWSHSSTIYGMQFDGVTIYRYTIEPEVMAYEQSNIGVVCHEFGHNLGALDYYDTDYANGGSYPGTGSWDLMGSGAWNGPMGKGDYPAPFTAWQKVQFGWMEATPLTATCSIDAMPAIGTKPVCYRLDTGVEGDYYMLENRQSVTPWDRYCVGHGLLVTHAIESLLHQTIPTNEVNSTWPQGFYTVSASAGSDPTEGNPASYGNIDGPSATFPGQDGHTTFSDATLPSCRSFEGRYSYVGISQITENMLTQTISFQYIVGDAPEKPQHFAASVQQGVVHLSWDAPTSTEQPISYTLYRNGTLLTSLTATEYADSEVSTTGLITYRLDATYANGLVSAYVTASTRLPINKATELTLTEDESSLTLSWKQPLELTRCVDKQQYATVEHFTNDFRYAHRFRPDDLLPYIGYKVRGINFIPMQPSTVASYKVCVWRKAATDHEPELVAQRAVSEFSPTYKRTVLLTSQPTIEEGYEYWVGVQIESNNNMGIAVVDQSELVESYGNWMSIGSTAWQEDRSATGNYIISATLTAPASPVLTTSVPSYTDFDESIDFYFPLAYRLYADDTLVATTCATTCTLPLSAVAGKKECSVVALYKGGNESKPLTISLGTAGITHTSATSHHSAAFDLQGRAFVRQPKHGIFIIDGKKQLR